MSASLSLPAFRLREARPTDDAFIFVKWKQSFKAFSDLAKVDEPSYFKVMGRIIRRLRSESGAVTRMLCDSEDDDNLMGFVVVSNGELHYAYLKGAFRKMGLAPLMLEGLDLRAFTWKTPFLEDRLKPKERGWEFRPRWLL